MKKTLLQTTNKILNSMDSEVVNSINDTEEALQVATIVLDVYEEFMADRNWPHLKTITQIDGLSDTDKPTKFSVADSIKEIVVLKYNRIKSGETRDRYVEIEFLSPEDFMCRLDGRDSTGDNIQQVVDYGATKLNIRTDIAPTVYTTFDDDFIVMDAFDSDVDTTLQTSKTQAVVYKSTAVSLTDAYVLDIPEEAFPALLAEAKSTAFVEVRQDANPKAEQKARRQRSWLSHKASRIDQIDRRPHYGRRPYTTQQSPKFDKN